MADVIEWMDFWNGIGLSNQTGCLAYDELKKKYSEKQRHYHTFEHIQSCLNFFKSAENEIYNKNAVLLAIYFHDSIYNPLSKTNEEESADYMFELIEKYSLGSNNNRLNEALKLAKKMILDTKNHHPSLEKYTDKEKNDVLIFLDIDMSILGSSVEKFAQYEKNVRKEYSVVDDKTFYHHRGKFLSELLNINIFKTKLFSFYLEKKAKNNIENILQNEGYQLAKKNKPSV